MKLVIEVPEWQEKKLRSLGEKLQGDNNRPESPLKTAVQYILTEWAGREAGLAETKKAPPGVRSVHITIRPDELPLEVQSFWWLYTWYTRHRLVLADWAKPEDREMIRGFVEDMKFISTQVVPTVPR